MPGWLPDWFIQWSDSVSLLDTILWIVGLVIAVVALRKFARSGWPWLKAFALAILSTAQIIDSVKGLPEFIARTDETLAAQDEKIAEIHHEVHYNNGSSVKDAVHRVETGVSGLYDRAALTDEKILALASADAELRQDLDDTRPKETP